MKPEVPYWQGQGEGVDTMHEINREKGEKIPCMALEGGEVIKRG